MVLVVNGDDEIKMAISKKQGPFLGGPCSAAPNELGSLLPPSPQILGNPQITKRRPLMLSCWNFVGLL